MNEFAPLFVPGRIGRLEIKNRLVMPPMVRNYAEPDGRANARYAAHIERIARGGVGTMVLEASFITPEGRGFARELGLHDDAVLPGLRTLVEAAHSHGAVIGPQLYHAGRQTVHAVSGAQPVAPSPIPDPLEQEMPHALTVEEIHGLTTAYAEAARRAREAGCDFVEVHAAHGYLINQFFSPFSNQRTDLYGGSLENRLRFAREVLSAVRYRVGPDLPITMRISGDELVDGGLSIDDTVRIAQNLQNLVDAFHVSAGVYGSFLTGKMIPPMAIPDGVLIPLASAVKRSTTVPIITVGKIRYPEMAAQAIRNGDADFVSLGRSLLADPDWPIKVQTGRLSEINHCVACNQGCISRLFAQKDVRCTSNPACGREELFAHPAGARKKVLVAGGGPAGMEAAKVAAERGHQVVLFEKSGVLGGQLLEVGSAPFRAGWFELREYLLRELDRLHVDIRTEAEVDPKVVKREHPDLVILATGAHQVPPAVPVSKDALVLSVQELLTGQKRPKGRVAVVGGSARGAQLAEILAQKGHPVTVLEESSEIAPESPLDDRALLLARLKGLQVKFTTGTKVLGVDARGLDVVGPQGPGRLAAETVIFSAGYLPESSLAKELAGVASVKVVGDALQPRSVTTAMEEGALAAVAL